VPSPSSAQLKSDLLPSLPADLESNLLAARHLTEVLAAPLSDEDQTVQANPDASPTKWHLAHTSWFFETFVLAPHHAGYQVFDPRYNYCFNSYYEAHGARHPRTERGLLTRPAASDIRRYRNHVDEALQRLFASGKAYEPQVASLLEIGLHHEQQHQELLLTDILSLFAANPLRPAYNEALATQCERQAARPMGWVSFSGGLYTIGHDAPTFAYDNESPSHRVYANAFKLADRLITNGEWQEFILDKGYDAYQLWLSDGWAIARKEAWQAPLYWEKIDGAWFQMTLAGLIEVDRAAPVSHISYYEADAFARWAGKRLASEAEWEIAASHEAIEGNMLSHGTLRPTADLNGRPGAVSQMFGDVWEWTQSAYTAYPGYKPAPGALGEYNGKFMCSQQVLRGGSCVTPDTHVRRTYRNFFYPHQRWQFSGLRLADEA
jgi:ergothioneine biosynthesis protein EgtB